MGDLEDMSEYIPLLLPAGSYRFPNLVNFMHSLWEDSFYGTSQNKILILQCKTSQYGTSIPSSIFRQMSQSVYLGA